MGQIVDAFEFMKTGYVGKITNIHSHMYRSWPHNKAQWTRPVLPDMNAENIVWKLFQGESQPHDFDPNRYINWRFFWDYSGGNFYENMCHQLAIWYRVLNLQIPTAVTTVGGIYAVKDGREVPDIMSTTCSIRKSFCSPETRASETEWQRNGCAHPLYSGKGDRPDGVEIVGPTTADTKNGTGAHMQNFFDCIRSVKEPNAPFDLGFCVSIACRMAVDSYRLGRTLHWDPGKEEAA